MAGRALQREVHLPRGKSALHSDRKQHGSHVFLLWGYNPLCEVIPVILHGVVSFGTLYDS